MPRKTYGRSRSGSKLTEAAIARKVAEAEAGLDVEKLRPRRGRPPIGSAAADPFPVRLDPELRQALDDRAVADDTTASEVIRQALRRFLEVG
jgi:predicted transcriptional regulator